MEQRKGSDFFTELENTRPFLKLALEGFAGSGKTFTASEIAIGLHRQIKSQLPIVFFDTERSLKALKPKFDKAKIKVLVKESRTLNDLSKTIDLCESGQSHILVIDSITHVWENFTEAYKKSKNRSFLQMLDWGFLKPEWKRQFSDKLVLANVHILFTGRAGFEYDQELNADTGKKELVKTGIKMKVEGETEYEPDVVVLMSKDKVVKKDKMKLIRVAQVIKDRTTVIDGKEFQNPTFKDFKPAIDLLLDGTASEKEIDETPDNFHDLEREHYQRRDEKAIAYEEYSNLQSLIFPSTSGNDKRAKITMDNILFGTTSETAIQKLPTADLQNAVSRVKKWKPEALAYFERQLSEGNKLGESDYKHALSLLEMDEEDGQPDLPFDTEPTNGKAAKKEKVTA